MSTAAAEAAPDHGRPSGWFVRALRVARQEPGFAFGLAVFALLLAVALLPWLFAGQSPFAIDVAKALQPPSAEHLFGTDDTGRDVYARVIHGTRVTLSICAGALLIAATIGGLAGLVSGYAGGWLDLGLGRLVDVVLSFPPIILGVVVTGILGPATMNLVLALAIVYLPQFFRIARSGALSESERTYVEAARCLGFSEATILLKHVLPNVLPLMLVQYMVLFPLVLQIQAALGFLGLGVQPPMPDWGAILQQGKDSILIAPWLSLFPGLAVLVSALALILVGRGLQRRIDRGG